jgi:hypothetical protein
MARTLLAGSPVLRRRLAVAFAVAELTDIHLDRLAVLAGIHDFGKALKGFQDKLEPFFNSTLAESRGHGPVAGSVGIEGGVVSGVINLESLG